MISLGFYWSPGHEEPANPSPWLTVRLYQDNFWVKLGKVHLLCGHLEGNVNAEICKVI